MLLQVLAVVGAAVVFCVVALLTGTLLFEKRRADGYRQQLIDHGINPIEED